jgi:hypothetical protein
MFSIHPSSKCHRQSFVFGAVDKISMSLSVWGHTIDQFTKSASIKKKYASSTISATLLIFCMNLLNRVTLWENKFIANKQLVFLLRLHIRKTKRTFNEDKLLSKNSWFTRNWEIYVIYTGTFALINTQKSECIVLIRDLSLIVYQDGTVHMLKMIKFAKNLPNNII